MKVRLAVDISGTRDGVPWPPKGSVIDLPSDEAKSMLHAGTAKSPDEDEPADEEPVPADDSPEDRRSDVDAVMSGDAAPAEETSSGLTTATGPTRSRRPPAKK